MLIDLGPFRGMIPRIKNPIALPAGAAQVAEDCKLWSKILEPFGGLALEDTPFHGANTLTIYRYENGGVTYWLNWDRVVHVVKGTVRADTLNRRFYSGDGAPKKFGNDIGVPATTPGGRLPKSWYWMGVRAPLKKPGLSIQVTGAGLTQRRTYAVTYVTGWGEESAPGAPESIDCLESATIRVRKGPSNGSAANTFTVDTATDEVILASHLFDDYSKVNLSNSGGALPAPLAAATDYYVIPASSGRFKLALNLDDALAGVAIDITSTGSGTHSVVQVGLDPRYNVVKWRIYRTVSGANSTDFAFVAEVSALSTQTYDDAALDDALGVPLATYDFDEPPADLSHLTRLPNGILCGFSASENQFLMSVPYYPYAWPDLAEYRRTLSDKPVALGAVGTMAVLGSEDKPETFVGTHPLNIVGDQMGAEQSAESARGLAEAPAGVIYASPDGAYLVSGPNVGAVVTATLFTRDDWQLTRPKSHIYDVHDGKLYGIYDSDGFGANKLLVIDPSDVDAALTTLNQNAKAIFVDSVTDAIYLLLDGKIWRWNARASEPLELRWRSAVIPLEKPRNMAVAKIMGDFTLQAITGGTLSFAQYQALRAQIAAYNAKLAANAIFLSTFGATAFGEGSFADPGTLPGLADIGQGVTFRLYAPRSVLRHEVVVTGEESFRLPGGYLADELAVEVEGRVKIERIQIASSERELRAR